MSDADANHAITDAHDDGHGHGPPGEPLGPLDVRTWTYAVAGAILGLLVVVALLVAGQG